MFASGVFICDLGGMASKTKRIERGFSYAVARVIRGEYTKRNMQQSDLAVASGEPRSTVQRVLAGKAPMTIERFELYCTAIGIDPTSVLDEALEIYGGLDRLLAEVAARNENVGSPTQDSDAELKYDEPVTRKRQVGMAAKRGVRKADQ